MPDIQFVNSPSVEVERLKMTAKVMGQGFYQKHGFVVSEVLLKEVDPNIQVVYQRELNYYPILVTEYQKEWDQVGKKFWAELESYFPGISMEHGRVEVRVTGYGTVSSVAELGKHKADKVVYYLRSDMDISHLASIMINNILFSERKGLGITWTKREALMDFIMTRPGMRKIFPKFRPMMSQLSRVSAKVRKASEKYLNELGFVSKIQEFEVDKMRLSKLEKKVMKVLVEHRGELVGYDTLADIVWGEGEFKTFWAINKLAERLRIKLDKLGIEGKRIESVRGQGYLLK